MYIQVKVTNKEKLNKDSSSEPKLFESSLSAMTYSENEIFNHHLIFWIFQSIYFQNISISMGEKLQRPG